MKDEIKEIDNSDLMELLETTAKKEFYRLTLDHELVVRLYNWITNLQEENETLKELCDKYEEEHNTAFKLWTMKMEEMPTYEEKEEYKSRIDKAIEYLNEPNRDEFDYSVTYLLEILQGGEE